MGDVITAAAVRIAKTIVPLALTVVAMVVIVVLATGPGRDHATSCLLRVQSGEIPPNPPGRVFLTQRDVLLSTQQGLFEVSADDEIKNLKKSDNAYTTFEVYDTAEGVLVESSDYLRYPEKDLYYLAATQLKRLEPKFPRYRQIRQSRDDVFFLFDDKIIKFEDGAQKILRLERGSKSSLTVDDKSPIKNPRLLEVGPYAFVVTENGDLYKIAGQSLRLIRTGFGPLFGHGATREGVFLSGIEGTFRLDDKDKLHRIAGVQEVCDLRLRVASDDNTEREIIKGFKQELETKRNVCAVLVVRAAGGSDTWTIAGFNAQKDFSEQKVSGPSHGLRGKLWDELKKGLINERKIVRLATSILGRRWKEEVLVAVYETEANVFLATTRRLLLYNIDDHATEVARPDELGVVQTVQNLDGVVVILAEKGVFRLEPTGGVRRINHGPGSLGVNNPGVMTSEGLFYMVYQGPDRFGANRKTYRLTADGIPRYIPLANTADEKADPQQADEKEDPQQIVETAAGILLATNKAVYRFQGDDGWVRLHGQRLEGPIEIKSAGLESPAKLPLLFVEASNGVFRWVNRPLACLFVNLEPVWKILDEYLFQVSNFLYNSRTHILIASGILLVLALSLGGRELYRRWRFRILVWIGRLQPEIFISYRRSDAGGYASALHRDLCVTFDERGIFFDRKSITPGETFPDQIRCAVESCSVLLAVIALDWLDVKGADGKPRLWDPTDFVAQEIGLALDRNKYVIPVLVGGATLPERDRLPKPLRSLRDRDALEIGGRETEYQAGLTDLVNKLARMTRLPIRRLRN